MTSWSPADIPDQSGRTALVTGANSGLGLHTTIELARHGARVVMACRDAGRAEAAIGRVRTEVPAGSVELLTLDLASLASVEAAAGELSGRMDRLDLLVDNAGVMAVPETRTADGFELQLGTNHLGHFALTGRLLPLLLRSTAPRVVVVASFAHKLGKMNFADLNSEKSYAAWGAYGQSKLANLLFVRELSVRARGTSLVVAAAHPGYAATHLQSSQNPVMNLLMKVGSGVLAQSDAQGAWPSLYAATMPDVRPDEYFGPHLLEMRGHPTRVGRTKAARDDTSARRLWAESERLTQVAYPFP